jgi:hypothetical protein
LSIHGAIGTIAKDWDRNELMDAFLTLVNASEESVLIKHFKTELEEAKFL